MIAGFSPGFALRQEGTNELSGSCSEPFVFYHIIQICHIIHYKNMTEVMYYDSDISRIN